MAFFDRLFRWKKKPFGKEPAQISASQKFQSGKPKIIKESTTPEHGTGQYAQVLLRPHITEQAGQLQAQHQYVFEVAPRASKAEVALAVRDLYGVVPEAVNVINMSGKLTRFGKTQGATKGWKKAIVTLPEGKTIDVYKK